MQHPLFNTYLFNAAQTLVSISMPMLNLLIYEEAYYKNHLLRSTERQLEIYFCAMLPIKYNVLFVRQYNTMFLLIIMSIFKLTTEPMICDCEKAGHQLVWRASFRAGSKVRWERQNINKTVHKSNLTTSNASPANKLDANLPHDSTLLPLDHVDKPDCKLLWQSIWRLLHGLYLTCLVSNKWQTGARKLVLKKMMLETLKER